MERRIARQEYRNGKQNAKRALIHTLISRQAPKGAQDATHGARFGQQNIEEEEEERRKNKKGKDEQEQRKYEEENRRRREDKRKPLEPDTNNDTIYINNKVTNIEGNKGENTRRKNEEAKTRREEIKEKYNINNRIIENSIKYRDKIKIATFNIQGNKFKDKNKQMEQWMDENAIDICAIQETQVS